VAVIGGGCAGVLVAAHLLRVDRRPREILIFEPRPQLGAGAAYSTDDERHLLNAPAAAMSAFEDDPTHFVAWLETENLGFGAADFVPRHHYRRYLRDSLGDELRNAAPGTELTWVHELVTSLRVEKDPERSGATRPGRAVPGRHRRPGPRGTRPGRPARSRPVTHLRDDP
jgi:uncharacterized NAD(P)/FAD-binding protein YdhS